MVHNILESACIEEGGFMFMYADTRITRSQFNTMYATYSAKYEAVRKEFDCESAFPHVYEKISKLGRTDILQKM